MRHIASLRDGDVVKYALVDEETGELTQFAQLQVPANFDFHQSALLGTNLASVLGLDGKRPPQPGVDASAPTSKKRGKGGRPVGGNLPGRYFISIDMIGEVLREHDPHRTGMTASDIATHLAKRPQDRDWVIKGISNRYNSERERVSKGGTSRLAWRVVQEGNKLSRAYLMWNGP